MEIDGQVWLEYELLSNPNVEGFFCVSTSYRAEPNPVEGRHETIFPMFEFEMKGGVDELEDMEKELCEWIGLPLDQVNVKTYSDWEKDLEQMNLTMTMKINWSMKN